MKEIILDSSLEMNVKSFEMNEHQVVGADPKEFDLISDINPILNHKNYIEYLGICWSNHYGIVISPTILWNIVLNNLAFEVNKNSSTYRKYFTESDEKQEIVTTQGGNLISVDMLVELLQNKIPNGIIDDFFPNFSTDTESSKLADKTAFLDMVSPYYNYGMFLCGIPKVKVLGEKGDWQTFMFQLGKITAAIPEFSDYLIGVATTVGDIAEEIIDYSNIFSLTRCGSGHQVEVSGWIVNFFMEKVRPAYTNNFITCISKIDYKCYNDGGNYRMYSGLFTSKMDDGYLIPDFTNIYFKKK